MNFCTKCQSIYSQPGTCNCYAPAQVVPYQPSIPFIPLTAGDPVVYVDGSNLDRSFTNGIQN